MKNTHDTHLSQKDMETWFYEITGPHSRLSSHGVIPKMQPSFVACNFEEKTAEIAYEVLKWELNPQNMIHGGITSTAFDTALGMLCHYYVKPHVVTTVSLHTTFHKPILLGDVLVVKGRISFLGRSLATITGEAWTQNDTVLAATTTATFKILHEIQKIPLT